MVHWWCTHSIKKGATAAFLPMLHYVLLDFSYRIAKEVTELVNVMLPSSSSYCK